MHFSFFFLFCFCVAHALWFVCIAFADALAHFPDHYCHRLLRRWLEFWAVATHHCTHTFCTHTVLHVAFTAQHTMPPLFTPATCTCHLPFAGIVPYFIYYHHLPHCRTCLPGLFTMPFLGEFYTPLLPANITYRLLPAITHRFTTTTGWDAGMQYTTTCLGLRSPFLPSSIGGNFPCTPCHTPPHIPPTHHTPAPHLPTTCVFLPSPGRTTTYSTTTDTYPLYHHTHFGIRHEFRQA